MTAVIILGFGLDPTLVLLSILIERLLLKL